MASATMSDFDKSAERNGEVAGVDEQNGGNLDNDQEFVREETNVDEEDVIDPNSQQFSNNATTLGIPITPETQCSFTESEKNVKEKRELEEIPQTAGESSNSSAEFAKTRNSIDSPIVTTPDDVTSEDNDDGTDYIESAGDERIACIEDEYIQRISILEQRHNELESVLERLTAAIECGIVNLKPKQEAEEASAETEEDTVTTVVDDKTEAATGEEAEKKEIDFSRGLVLDLFVEFQHKIRNFAEDLNGVLNCSEAAIRHARVVQEWATSVQLMFEQLKEERHKILNYIDERERNMMIIKEQFVAELEEQGKTLKQLVEEMMSHHDLQKEGEDYCKTKADSSCKRSTVEKIVDLLLKRRLEEDKSIILNLNKQSKISEMKLFIIHQQSCIQQLQEQNKELRAIIEGLMGPDDVAEDVEEENPCDSEQSGTPASVNSQDQCLLRQTLEKQEPSISLVSDVLYCDRGEYLPGNSTDGDVATVQAYGIGRDGDEINSGENIVFDPLSVSYVREQCQQAEETERQAHLTMPQEDIEEPVVDSYVGVEEDDVQQDLATENETDVDCLKEDGEVKKKTVDVVEQSADQTDEHNAAGDGVDVINEKAVSPKAGETISPKAGETIRSSSENKEESLE